MIRYDELPQNNADLAKLAVDFPRLRPDGALGCPATVDEILEYLEREVPNGDLLLAEDLEFLRTANVQGTQYWIWRFSEPGGSDAYATVALRPDATRVVGYDANSYELTPEQFILGDFYDVF